MKEEKKCVNSDTDNGGNKGGSEDGDHNINGNAGYDIDMLKIMMIRMMAIIRVVCW